MMQSISGTKEEVQLRKTIAKAPEEQQGLFLRAMAYAIEKHDGQTRKSGEPYVIHPLGIADRLYTRYADIDLAAAALLHDIVEDCPTVPMSEIYERFGDTIGFLVDAVTKTRNTFEKDAHVVIDDRIERLLFAAEKDVRVLLLKIADRENNLSTIQNLKQNKQIRMAFETQAVYEPLKRILGYDSKNSIPDAAAAYAVFTKKHKLRTPAEIKEVLISESFENLDTDMFGLVYGDSQSIIWKITDFDTYTKICETESLEEKIEFVSISGTNQWFEAVFIFKGGALLDGSMKLSISSFRG